MSLVGQELLDYAAGVPSAEAIERAGFVGVIRYVSDPRESWAKGKPLTKAEADALKGRGMIIVSNWQYAKGGNTTSDWTRGADGARLDAPRGLRLHQEAGGPDDAPIIVSVDANPTRQMYVEQVRPYLQTWQEIIGRARLGVYCNQHVLNWCLEDGIGTYYWQHGWDGRPNDMDLPIHPAAHIVQYQIDTTADGITIGVDKNRILKEEFGQWHYKKEDGNSEMVDIQQLAERIEGMRGTWKGDPTWLPDVFTLWDIPLDWVNAPSPLEFGHGDFIEVRGVIGHHTAGGGLNDWRVVKWGRSGLPGPLAQLVLEKDGRYKFIAVGVAYHAGSGRGSVWSDKFTTDANWYTIGIEAVSKGTPPWDWTEIQLANYKRGVAAILWFLKKDASWFAGHREYNKVDGKIDPAGIDLDEFRRDVQALIDAGPGVKVRKNNNPFPPTDEVTGIEQCRLDNPWLGAKLIAERELECPDGLGRYCHYEHGSIYFHPDTGIHPIPKGGIYELWESFGWENSWLGYPIDNPTDLPGGKSQSFQGGGIYARTGEQGWPMRGGIGIYWLKSGGVTGPYGWPTSREYEEDPETFAQDFEKGVIRWRFTAGIVGTLDRTGRDEKA